jgi:hypothetical protein
MNRKLAYASVAVAALAVPVALAALPAASQEANRNGQTVIRLDADAMNCMIETLRGPDGRFTAQPGPQIREMVQQLQAQARGGDRNAQVRPQGPQPRGPQAAPPPRAQLMPPRPPVNPLEQFDTNKDGATTQAEIDAMRADRLKRFDRNNDGKLNLEEYAALWLDAYRRQMVDQFQAHDDDGDGLITFEEFNENFATLVRRYDRNGDGKVDATDVARPQGMPPAAAPGGAPTRAPGGPANAGPRPI